MTRAGRLMIGAITAGALLFFGITMLVGQRWVFGGVLVALGLFRAVVLFQQWRE